MFCSRRVDVIRIDPLLRREAILQKQATKMEVEVISAECIKPSSPTPHHLRTYKLSFLDQFIPSVHIPLVLFYEPIYPSSIHIVPGKSSHELLKQSLSQTLTHYYPLAGKIKDGLSIDCNDEGAYYVEARVKNCTLSEFLDQPDISSVHKFLPCENPNWKESDVGAHVAMIQANMFDCGGIAIAALFSHMIFDGVALSTFLKHWAGTSRRILNGNEFVFECPDFTPPSLFPQNDSFPKDLTLMAMWRHFLKTGKPVTKRFVFHSSAISKLKEEARTFSVQNPTRVEVVSTLIWKSTMAAFKSESGFEKPSLLTHSVNLRPRVVPPLSEHAIGNLIWLALAKCKNEMETDWHHLVQELRESITNFNCNFLKTKEGERGFLLLKYCEALKDMGEVFFNEANKGVNFLGFTSMCNSGLNEVDFGWGRPVWVSSVVNSDSSEIPVFLNLVTLADTRWGDGIEAWVTLDEGVMTVLEGDSEFCKFATLDPSPLQYAYLVSRL